MIVADESRFLMLKEEEGKCAAHTQKRKEKKSLIKILLRKYKRLLIE